MSLPKTLVRHLLTCYAPADCVKWHTITRYLLGAIWRGRISFSWCTCGAKTIQTEHAQRAVLLTKNKHSLVNWCNFIREVCEQYLETHQQQHGGSHDDGSPIVVEIDESKYFHRKHHWYCTTVGNGGALGGHRTAQRQVLYGGSPRPQQSHTYPNHQRVDLARIADYF